MPIDGGADVMEFFASSNTEGQMVVTIDALAVNFAQVIV